MRYLTLGEILYLHEKIIETSGGSHGIRNMDGLESSLALPKQAFGDTDLYPSVIDKAAILCFSIVSNHPFIDGNKRVGHAAMETFLLLNGIEISAEVDEQEQIMLDLAAGKTEREEFARWVQDNIIQSQNYINLGKLV